MVSEVVFGMSREDVGSHLLAATDTAVRGGAMNGWSVRLILSLRDAGMYVLIALLGTAYIGRLR